MADWRTLLLEMDRAVESMVERMNRWIEEKIAPSIPSEPYESAVRDGEPKNRVVKVADVMKMAHVMAARITFRTLPGIWKNKLGEIVLTPTSRWVAARAAAEVIDRLPSPRAIIALIKNVFSVAEQSALEKDIEKQIRAMLAPMRKEMETILLSQAHIGPRRVVDVLTRNPSPPKRRLKKWKSV